MATIIVTLEIPVKVLVKGDKEEYIKSITEAASRKYNHLNKIYGKIQLEDE